SGGSFQDAVRELAAKVGGEIPEQRQEGEEPHKRLYEAVAFAAEFFQERLWEGSQGERARRYLAGRGIGAEAARRFGLGFAPEEWRALREAAQRHGIADEVLLDAGLVKEREHTEDPYDRVRERLIFPIAELGGRVVGFGGRILRPAENAPKYLNSPETPIYRKGELLYGLNWARGAIRREGAALVVEGYMDYVSLAARGLENVAAGLGTAMTAEQANLLARYCGKALLLYDSDQAGLKASFRTADALLRAGVHPLLVTLPEGEDPDSLAREGGIEAVRPHLAAAADVLERKLAILEERGAFQDVDGVRRALDRLLPTIRATVDPSLRDIYISRVAARTGVRRETLERQAAQATEARGPVYREAQARPRAQPRQAAPGAFASERLLVKLLLRDPARLGMARTALRGVRLHDPRYRAIYEALVEGIAPEALPGVLGGPAAAALDGLQREANEITDAEGTFNSIVADLRVPDLFVRVQYVRDRLARERADVALMREWQELHAELGRLGAEGRLGAKISRRYRSVPRAPEPEGTPPERDE
ncbi:MAG: DNA primase, partial [Gemmatimonadetes bacterium]|nr:DNA primase [Gemmatimonadota bacterium]